MSVSLVKHYLLQHYMISSPCPLRQSGDESTSSGEAEELQCEAYLHLAEVCTRRSRGFRQAPLEWFWLCVHAASLLHEVSWEIKNSIYCFVLTSQRNFYEKNYLVWIVMYEISCCFEFHIPINII